MAEIVQVLQALQGSNNELRVQAEKTYEDTVKQSPEIMVGQLVQATSNAALDEATRTSGAVMLRQLLKRTGGAVYKEKLAAASQTELRSACLAAFEADATPVKKHLGEVVVCLGELVDGLNEGGGVVAGWPELLPALFRLVQTQKAPVLAVLRGLTDELPELAQKLLSEQALAQVFAACSADADTKVRKEFCLLVCAFLQNTSRGQWGPLKPYTLSMATLAGELAGSNAEDAEEVLSGLNDTCEEAPQFFSNDVPALLKMCGIIGSSDTLPNNVRRVAVDTLCTLAKPKKGKYVTGCPGYVEGVVELCIKLSLDLDDDAEGWAEEEESDDETENLHGFGKESLDLFCRNLGGEQVLPHVYPRLGQLLAQAQASGTWQPLVAAICNMARLAEYIEDQAKVDEMVTMVLRVLDSGEPRVRYAAWACIAQFGEDHKPHVPDTYAADICTAFVKALGDTIPKVVIRAMQAFQLFSQSLDQDTLEPHAEGILQKLLPHLQHGVAKASLTGEAIQCVSTLAEQMKEAFAPTYPHVMPLVTKIMKDAGGKPETRELFGKCIECIALLGKSAGPAMFKADAVQVMEVLVEACKNTTEEDVASEYIMTAGMYICETLKRDFVPFLPAILPLVLTKIASVKPINLTEEGLEKMLSGGADDDEKEISISIVGDKVLGIKTAQIEDMQGALNFVKVIVDELEDAFCPYVQSVATAMLPVFEFELGEEVRETGFEVWAALLKVARKAKEAGAAEAQATLKELANNLILRVCQGIETEDRVWELTQANGLQEAIKAAGPGVLVDAEVAGLADKIFARLDAAFQRRGALAVQEAQAAADGESEDDDDDEEINVKQVDIKIRAAHCEVLGSLMMHHSDHFVSQVLPKLLPLVTRFSHANSCEEDRKLGLYVFDDMLEHLGERVTALPCWAELAQALLRALHDESPALRQAANYGLTLAGKLAAFRPMANETVKLLMPVIAAKAKGKKKQQQLAARDNAISAFGVLLKYHEEAIPDAKAAWAAWLAQLPLKQDEEEGVKVHGMLLELVQAQHTAVIGEGYANVPKILAVMADVYGTDMVDEDGTKKLFAVIGTLGTNGIAQFGATLTAKQQKKLERMWRDLQKQSKEAFSPPGRAAA